MRDEEQRLLLESNNLEYHITVGINNDDDDAMGQRDRIVAGAMIVRRGTSDGWMAIF
jgi:hypothetical protein